MHSLTDIQKLRYLIENWYTGLYCLALDSKTYNIVQEADDIESMKTPWGTLLKIGPEHRGQFAYLQLPFHNLVVVIKEGSPWGYFLGSEFHPLT